MRMHKSSGVSEQTRSRWPKALRTETQPTMANATATTSMQHEIRFADMRRMIPPARPPKATMDAREAAWSAIHDLLPDRGRVGPPDYDPATPTWTVTARPGTAAGAARTWRGGLLTPTVD